MGQQTPAVVTAHGVVVGGNRRLCCFHRTKTLHSMECVILDERYSQNASALLILEKLCSMQLILKKTTELQKNILSVTI